VRANIEGDIMIKMIVITLFTLTLAACNTVHGVGQDVEKAGEAIKKSTQ
jgi:predicted small secreted protein